MGYHNLFPLSFSLFICISNVEEESDGWSEILAKKKKIRKSKTQKGKKNKKKEPKGKGKAKADSVSDSATSEGA